jgi:hypothetical protein
VAETNARRLRRDPRRGVMVSLPKDIAERLPDEAEVEFSLREDDAVIEMKLVELVRKPLKLK